MPKSKHKEKRLHFAGYDFTSGPEGTVVHRSTPKPSEFRSGDRVQYRDVNLWQQGTVSGADGKWIMVRWDGNSFESREWAPNLRHASTGAAAHAKKKSSAQLDREIAEALGKAATGRSHARVARTATSAADAGFAIHTDHEDVIKDNARDHFGPDYGDAAERAKMMKAGLVDATGKITDRGWEVLNKDFRTLETNALTWLRKIFGRASDQGHDSSGDLIGSVSFNPRNATQAHNVVVGKNERVDFSDASYGDFARSGAWKGVSNFGQSVLGGHITFFDIQPPEAFEIAEETADKAAARRRAARKR